MEFMESIALEHPGEYRSSLRTAVMLDGDPFSTGAAATKFQLFVDEIGHQSNVVGIADLTLRGSARRAAAVAAWRPTLRRWKEHYRKNPLTFVLRSRHSARWLQTLRPRPDVILQVGAMSNPAGEHAIPFALYLDFTFALTNREWPDRVPMWPPERIIWRRMEQRAYEDAALIFSRSEYVARSLESDYGVPQSKIVVVGAGVHLPIPPRDALVERPEPRALFIGSDFRRKGGDVVLDAWPRVLEQVPDARLSWIGPIPTDLPPRVDVLGRSWNPLAVIHELQRSRVFVMPSRCETWGDVFLEAMAYGLPCIGTTADAMPEIIAHGRSGYVVPPNEPGALADRLVAILQSGAHARCLGLAGRERVERYFQWEHVTERMLRALESSLSVNESRLFACP